MRVNQNKGRLQTKSVYKRSNSHEQPFLNHIQCSVRLHTLKNNQSLKALLWQSESGTALTFILSLQTRLMFEVLWLITLYDIQTRTHIHTHIQCTTKSDHGENCLNDFCFYNIFPLTGFICTDFYYYGLTIWNLTGYIKGWFMIHFPATFTKKNNSWLVQE